MQIERRIMLKQSFSSIVGMVQRESTKVANSADVPIPWL